MEFESSQWRQRPCTSSFDSHATPVNVEEGEPNAEVPEDARIDDALVDSQPGACGLVDENMPTLKRKLEELSNREAGMDGLETWCRKAQRIRGEYWSMVQAFREGRSLTPQQVERVNDLSKEVEDILGHCSFRKGWTTHAAGRRKSLPLVTTELADKESKKTINKICNYLMEDEIVIIGIYGMAGVGKTTILMHVHNRVLEDPTFSDVFWVTVPRKFSICKLQNEIANVVGLDNLSMDKDVKRRACILNRHLKRKRAVLCLDGLWMHFDIEDVGIPVENGGIKLVLTTGSLDVCDKMVCQKKVKINPLERPDDCWVLFLKKLCFGRDLPSEVKKIASSILCKCGGLPLGIIEIATHLRGLQEVHEWEDLLQELENSMMELDVFKKLKLTYMNLRNLQVQQCFLHLILCFGECYFEEENIEKVLIESFIDEGLLSGRATRQELHKKGNTILDKLKKACLGVDIDIECLLVHPLIRDMALQIVTNTTHMVKANMGLKEIPEEELWTDHLEKVFLQNNDIKVIPYSISPNCPKLTRLSLNDNVSLEAIHKSFFRHMKGLKVLDLSRTKIMELPDTISDLESLEALLLRECEKLCHIPCVQKLGCLRKLDLSGCAMLEEVPEGMEMSVKLTYLDLLGTKIKTLSEGLLGKLVNLQYLAINFMMEVEGLYCYVPHVETFNTYVRLLKQNSSQQYELALGASRNYFFRDKHKRRIIIESCLSIAAMVDGEIGGDGRALLPRNVQVLKVGQCSGLTSLSEVGPLNNLEELKIKEWKKLEELGAVHFPCLRRLNITQCTKLKHFLKEGHELRCLQWFKIKGLEELEEINIAAPFLYNIKVYRCPKMKWVVKWQWLATHFPNLRSIKIKDCGQLEEILGGLPPIGATFRLTKIEIEGCNCLKGVLMTCDISLHLPFLQHVMVKDCMGIEAIIGIVPNMTQPLHLINLTLRNLPELKTICEGTVSWLSIQYMRISECPKLKRLPLLDKGPSDDYDNGLDGDIWIDELTWQSLEWDHSPFHPSLRHLAWRYGVSNWHDQRICVRIESRDAITSRVDGFIGGDGRNLLPRNVQVLEAGGGSEVTSLSEVGPPENQKELTIKDCEKLEELSAVHFPQLEGLDINCCSKLKHLSVEGQGFPHLRWFTITSSEELEGIDLDAPNLNSVNVWCCHKMKRAVEWDWLTTRLPNLKSIGIIYCEKLEEIIGGPLPIGATCLLIEIKIEGCNNMKGVLLTHDMLLHIPFLQDIRVERCKGIEVIIGTAPNMTQSSFPKLTRLTLRNLPELKRICDRMESCDHIQYIEIDNCPKLKKIPLRLHPLDNGLLSPPPSLGQILIDHKETWQALEWDHPLAPISLEPFIEFIYGELPKIFMFLLFSPFNHRSPTVRKNHFSYFPNFILTIRPSAYNFYYSLKVYQNGYIIIEN
ncbi:probable disease resistance protein At4g27220 [Eucalyptus grandis]|uniref:probable disease resistance protein At4g27220 n=1 Tax=Eucalyptus grandis TaxID=71139 RepID=UPI00192EA964|nr:probable disease resistance protein At4g27220 [Eucalyptus grandis]